MISAHDVALALVCLARRLSLVLLLLLTLTLTPDRLEVLLRALVMPATLSVRALAHLIRSELDLEQEDMADTTSSSYLRQIVKFFLQVSRAAFIAFVSAVNEQFFILAAKVLSLLLPQQVHAAVPVWFTQRLTSVWNFFMSVLHSFTLVIFPGIGREEVLQAAWIFFEQLLRKDEILASCRAPDEVVLP